MPKRVTKMEREVIEAEEARVALAQFEAEKSLRLLKAIARAQSHGLGTYFYYDNIYDDVRIRVTDNDPYGVNHDVFYSEMNQYGLRSIEAHMDEMDSELQEKQKQAELKKAALSKLTKEEQQLLGLV
jgi:hypothetical protein